MSCNELIKNFIKENDSISLEKFMEIALYDLNYGYYTTNTNIIKDYTTSPEISPLFGECIAIWLIKKIELLVNKNKQININIVEYGAGNGTMMKDILRVLEYIPQYFKLINIYFVEISPKLIENQRNNLLKYQDKIKWIDDIDNIDNDYPTLIISNEFFDALPIKQFILKDKTWNERHITINSEDKLDYCMVPSNIDLPQYEDGTIIETRDNGKIILNQWERYIKCNQGAILAIDYGYTESPKISTLQSIKGHKYNDIFDNIGHSDLTALVDFTSLTKASIISQRSLLTSLGI
ncbi:MAG: SAM-dependent methyltransferase, partial [Anaplasmataceae bacterium]|nr:SAM-dependent methyltransferase [Anaplasmataceae bacterium]